jgi:urease accessory protein
VIELLHAIWQADSGFPSGSFAFSGGLEAFYALTPADGSVLPGLLHDMLLRRWASSDRVALCRAHRAGGASDKDHAGGASDADRAGGASDADRAGGALDLIAAADAALDAAILVQALREGSRRNGMALLVAHERLGTAEARPLRAACRDGRCLGHLAVVQGALFRAIGMDLPAAIAAAGYGAAAALITAAVRLGRIGAIEGQRALAGVLPLLAELAAHPPPPDTVPEGFLPLLDIAAARHMRAPMRLFAT